MPAVSLGHVGLPGRRTPAGGHQSFLGKDGGEGEGGEADESVGSWCCMRGPEQVFKVWVSRPGHLISSCGQWEALQGPPQGRGWSD